MQVTMLAVKKAEHLDIETKMASEYSAIKGFLLASQSECVPQSCSYVKVACLSCGEYSNVYAERER